MQRQDTVREVGAEEPHLLASGDFSHIGSGDFNQIESEDFSQSRLNNNSQRPSYKINSS